jgi:hypothetical protein
MNRSFGATNAKDTCLWCGWKLRVFLLDRASRNPISTLYTEAAQKQDRDREQRRQERVAEQGPRRGDYGDGFFCGLRCAYEFAVALAQHGRRLQPKEVKEDGTTTR